jgi:transaldolase
MIKIPATVPCLESVQAMIAAGRNVNVTLIFSLDRYQKVMDAFIAGLEERLDAGLSINGISSVASFFISRVDAEVDKRLDLIGTPTALALRGRAAVAQAKLAYDRFRTTFSGMRWEALAQHGASVQRPLWASTSTKNPSYPDTLYVDELIGHDSVNTLPDATLEAFADHGTLRTTIDQNVHESHQVWAALAEVGVDMDDVARQLEDEGVLSFQKSFDELLAALSDKAQTF